MSAARGVVGAPSGRMHALLRALDEAHAEAAGLTKNLRGPEEGAARRLVAELVQVKRAARGLALVSGHIRPAELDVGSGEMRVSGDTVDEIVELLEAMDTYIEYGEAEEQDYNDTVDGFKEALRLARGLRGPGQGRTPKPASPEPPEAA